MSFGYSVGDFLAVGQLCWKVYRKCKDSPGSYTELSSEVDALHNVIKETEELLSEQDLTAEQKVKVVTSRQGCEEVLKDLDGLLVKYESLGTSSRRTFDRMGFGMQDMNGIRLRLISNVSMLDAFNNTSSNARLETKMNLLIAEIRAGKREGSVISTQTFDTTARNDQEIWEALRRELEDIGISPAVITEKRQFIITWFQEAVAAGKLEEDAPSEYDDRAVSLYESDDLAGTSDEDSAPDRQISTMTIGPHTTKRNTNEESRPNAPRLSRQPADVSNLRPRQGKGKSQFGVSYLMKMLRGRDQRFLEAARAGDESMVKKLLEKGVDIQSQGLQNHETDTALHLASINGKEATVRLLLSKGADVHAKSEKGWTALHQAVYCGNKQVVELLLEKGADICAKSEKGWTALYQAACCDNKQVVELLLKNGADVYAKTEGGGTALRQAAYGGHEQVVKMLLEKGADVHAKSVDGWTALHEAAYGGHEQVVRLLLENGAGLESNALSGSTALMEAAIRGHVSVVQLLLDKGAKVDRKDKKGRTALPMAGNETVSQLLRKAGAGR